MCRLFGTHSASPVALNRPFTQAANSLQEQSKANADGWGMAHYPPGQPAPRPSVKKGTTAAFQDSAFDEAAAVSTRTAIAHVRLATVGETNLNNNHPFTYGQWTFAHNGNVNEFHLYKDQVLARIAPDLRERIKGSTDSEHCFFLFLTELRAIAPGAKVTAEEIARAIAKTSAFVCEISKNSGSKWGPTMTNFLVTDGKSMVACRRNRTLHFTDGGAPGSAEPADFAPVEQFTVASEPIGTEATQWFEVPNHSVVAVDRDRSLHRWELDALV
jgi:predicted glutamine amidotransferase